MRPFASVRRSATAARIAWRDLRKDPRQGVLVALLVALPAVVLMTVSTVNAGQQPTDAQRITRQLGANEAWVQPVGPAGAPVTQSPDDPSMMEIGDPTTMRAMQEIGERDVAGLLPEGTRMLRLAQSEAYLSFDEADAAGTFRAVVGPAWDPAFAGMYDVASGGAPADDEVMVSTGLAERWGLDVGDTLTVGRDGVLRSIAGVISAPSFIDNGIVFGTEEGLRDVQVETARGASPITYLPDLELDWDAVQALNADGVAVYSRVIAEDPPSEYLDAAQPEWGASGTDPTGVILGVGLGLVEVVLLAGAAFAVSMRRRQERLALLAATGAGRGTLVGVGVWNGVLLGLAGGVIGVPVGFAVGAGWLTVLETFRDASTQVWGIRIVWGHVGAIVAFTAVAGALAAVVPAIAAARRDVMAALRGSRKPARPRRWPSLVGAVLVAAAAATLGYSVHLREAAWEAPEAASYAADALAAQVTLAGVVLLFAGFMSLTPAALRLAARGLGRVSLGARLASRDAARHAGRTVPVVAAIGVTVLIAGFVVLNEVRTVETYASGTNGQAQPGDAYVPLQTWQVEDGIEVRVPGDAGALTARTQGAFPDIEALVIDQPLSGDGTREERRTIARLPDESLCPVWDPETQTYDMSAITKREMAQDPRCAREDGPEEHRLAVGSVVELEYILGRHATEAEQDMLNSGGAVVVDPLLLGPDAKDGSEGTVRLESWDVGGDTYVGDGEPAEVADVPAIVGVPEQWVAMYSVIVSLEAARTAGTQASPDTLFLHRDAGFTELEEDQLEAALMRGGEFHVSVQRPIDWGVEVITWGALIATLLVAGAAAGLALGLARADARRDDLTLASLGASPRLARSIAAWQGGILVAFAVWSGLLCAAVLDVIRAMGRATPGVFAWDVLAVGLVVPPLVVGGLAWLMTRQPSAVHFRLAA